MSNLKTVKIMEKKQFTFTGLGWMTPEEIMRTNVALKALELYGITFDFRHGTEGTRFIIEGYDDILENPDDDSAITFIRQISADGPAQLGHDAMLIFTVDDNMKVASKLVHYDGSVTEIK